MYFIILCIKIIQKQLKITLGVIKTSVSAKVVLKEFYMKERNEWKTGNKRYLKELQKMFDIIENVQD